MTDLHGLLQLAMAKPTSVGSRGAPLALAMHCLMVREGGFDLVLGLHGRAATLPPPLVTPCSHVHTSPAGFSVQEDPRLEGKRVRHSSYQPPANWQAEGSRGHWGMGRARRWGRVETEGTAACSLFYAIMQTPVHRICAGPDTWNFSYTRPQKANSFKLEVALQDQTGRCACDYSLG